MDQTGIPYDDLLSKLPTGYSSFDVLRKEFMDSIPPGTPAQARALFDRVFVSGAMSVLGQVHAAFADPATEGGDPSVVISVVNALGVGVAVAMDECMVAAGEELARTQCGGIIIPINQAH